MDASIPAPTVAVHTGAPTPHTCNADNPTAVAIILMTEFLYVLANFILSLMLYDIQVIVKEKMILKNKMAIKEDITDILFAIYKIPGEFAIGAIIAFAFWNAMRGLTNKGRIWMEKSARLWNLLIAVIFSVGLIFSATMPNAKNQSKIPISNQFLP